jgi:hypothetical protein
MPHTDCRVCGLHSRPGEEVHTVSCTNQAVGRIVDLDRYRTRPPECSMCPVYRKAIRDHLAGVKDYLGDYTSRGLRQESDALWRLRESRDKLRAVLGD